MNDIVVYWRPGCMFCSALLRQLDRRGVAHRRVDIWSDPKAAAQVRALANGNETVPTVTIGSRSLVNPGIRELIALASEVAPHTVPDDDEAPKPGRFRTWIQAKLSSGSPTEPPQ